MVSPLQQLVLRYAHPSDQTFRNHLLGAYDDSRSGNPRGWCVSDSPSLNCDGPTITTLGRNIIGDNSCVPNPGQNGDLLGADPKLGPWYIPLHAYVPNADSPAIDRGAGCSAVDQRGFARPLGAACDVGSIERGWRVFMPLVDK